MDRARAHRRHFRHISAVFSAPAREEAAAAIVAAAATLYDVWSREAFLWDPIMPPLPRAAATAARPHHGHRACGAAAGFPTMLLRSPILPPLLTISLYTSATEPV